MKINSFGIFFLAKCWFLTHWPLGDSTEYLDEQLKLVIVGWSISCETDLRWISLDLTVSMEDNGLVPSGNPFWISIVFSCDQAALQMVFSVCLSVCPSVRLSVCPSVHLSVCPSHLFDYVPIIASSWNFQELLPMTDVRSMQKVKVRGQRSRSQRSRPILTVSGL